ncbi:helix-turn-helix domain-containing protein [Streptomyces sp. 1331.2]|uniref:helix-turn-helix domain-containing protein n=1 Tax=Streptomyces sp. 1331.2 TaxID=1938835 RepID=UPI000BCE3E98|nr:helix-turn-helix domain-containing protein [Streptomyces sp. 1331.2]SOB84238.1 Helix-turn-helix domain-containing protein [Streptomyces sp. 1331.2]
MSIPSEAVRLRSAREEWLTPAETAKLAKLTPGTLANHRYQGIGIPYTKLTPGRGGRVRYRRSDVEKWLSGDLAAA